MFRSGRIFFGKALFTRRFRTQALQDGSEERDPMRFGLFGSATAGHSGPDVDSGQGYRQFVEYNVEAEALGVHSTFLVEHHFTGYGQVSASLALLTWVAARTTTLRLGTAVMV